LWSVGQLREVRALLRHDPCRTHLPLQGVVVDYRCHVRAPDYMLAFHPRSDQFIKAFRCIRLDTEHRTRIGLGLAQPRN
jgi:hypothetical protein